MPRTSRSEQPTCEHCGELIVRAFGKWYHMVPGGGAGDAECEGTPTRKAAPQDEIR